MDGDHDLKTSITVGLAEASSSIFLQFAKLLEGQEESVSVETVKRIGAEMVACAKEGIYWSRIDFNVVIGRKPVYYRTTIRMPHDMEIVASNPEVQQGTEYVTKVKPRPVEQLNVYAFQGECMNNKALTISGKVEKDGKVITRDSIIGNTAPAQVENIEKAIKYRDEPTYEVKMPLPHEVSLNMASKKLMPHEMAAAAALNRQKKPLPHETTFLQPTRQEIVKKLLPHEKLARQ
jgi:hypothetical protein